MEILTFIVVLFMAYLLWRIVDQLPDVTFRLSEIQRDLAEIRRRVDTDGRQAPPQLTTSPTEAEPEAAVTVEETPEAEEAKQD